MVFLYVAPSLESRLRGEKLDALRAQVERHAGDLAFTLGNVRKREVDAAVSALAQSVNARVTLVGVSRGGLGLKTYVVSDSGGPAASPVLALQAARAALRADGTAAAVEPGPSGAVAEAARPIEHDGETRVVVFSSPLNDVSDAVSLIRRRILVAGVIALALAVLAGLLIARALSSRVKRLQRAARRVARGDFSARFPADRPDELGELAMALDDMQRQLAQLDDARKRFIATASHELRTPIFSLSGFVELLADEDLDEAERESFLVQIREQVDRLGKLTTELLDLSRLEAGSLELRPEPTDLNVIAEAVAAEFIPALSRHGSHLELRLPRGGTDAVCDPDRVAQVLRILIDNALTHTPDGTDVVVAASRANGQVQLDVRDFGPGIKRAVQERIFEPFYTSDDAQGSGLGLAIAHELAERMDGRLSVDSQPGRTTFSFELPA